MTNEKLLEKNNFMAPFYRWGSTLLFTTKFPLRTHFAGRERKGNITLKENGNGRKGKATEVRSGQAEAGG